jgi:hypothetical protein
MWDVRNEWLYTFSSSHGVDQDRSKIELALCSTFFDVGPISSYHLLDQLAFVRNRGITMERNETGMVSRRFVGRSGEWES